MKTIEEKAKAYDEAIKRAKDFEKGEVHFALKPGESIVHWIFPELADSEDERIRKKLIGIFTNQSLCDVYNLKSEDVLAYLERQKEQKHYCPSNDDLEDAAREFRGKCLPPIEPISDELIDIIKGEFEGFRRLLKKKGIDYEPQRSYWEGFARLFDSSAREYVKEQKEQKPKVDSVEYERGFLAGQGSIQHWKPSEEQMECLLNALGIINLCEGYEPLRKLYEQLKKL